MIKKEITYTDYNGIERTEEFYFNLTKAELMEMELTKEGGFLDEIKRIVQAKDTVEIVKLFKEIILKAYGQKSSDGKRFIKSKELSEEFTQTEAYSILYVELATNAEEASKFINGIIPADLAAEAQKMIDNGQIDAETKALLNEVNNAKAAN
jgi:hypothetical protein